ncbi:MAG: hypothetical protein RMY34_26395 [Aulosira sp. DedQUE10]|nr:hypothetical protein [Aulosira sp. DedQUE10]
MSKKSNPKVGGVFHVEQKYYSSFHVLEPLILSSDAICPTWAIAKSYQNYFQRTDTTFILLSFCSQIKY